MIFPVLEAVVLFEGQLFPESPVVLVESVHVFDRYFEFDFVEFLDLADISLVQFAHFELQQVVFLCLKNCLLFDVLLQTLVLVLHREQLFFEEVDQRVSLLP